MKYKIMLGCQTITWGEAQDKKFPEIFTAIANAGYSGVDIGWRRFETVKPGQVKQMLNNAGLKLTGLHIGGNLDDPEQAKGEWNMLDPVISGLKILGSNILGFSGLIFKNELQFSKDLEKIKYAMQYCADKGIKFLYHNHNWEFDDKRKVWDALLSMVDLKFWVDIGWIYKGTKGGSITSVLNEIKGRIGAVHFKDFATSGTEIDTVKLGHGFVPLAEAAEWLKENLQEPIWVNAEQDTSSCEPIEAITCNAKYLKKIFN